MNHIEIVREDHPSRLGRQRWRFWVNADFSGIRVLLDDYRNETRPTTRHKWQQVYEGRYCRIDRRDSTMPAHAVPQPRDVLVEVLYHAMRSIRVLISDARDVEAPFGVHSMAEAQCALEDAARRFNRPVENEARRTTTQA